MTTKRCVKLHKQFLTELESCRRLEKEGHQVVSSLANVGERVHLLTSQSQQNSPQTSMASSDLLGVLTNCAELPTQLLQRHFVAMDKSHKFLVEILKDFRFVLENMQRVLMDFHDLFDMRLQEEPEEEFALLSQMAEWMENVLWMYEREYARKRELSRQLEYSNDKQLQLVAQHWNSSSRFGQVDRQYVELGL